MAIFSYVSVDGKGNTKKGILDGDSAQHIRQQLQDMNLTLIELTPLKDKNQQDHHPWSFSKKARVSTSTLSVLTFQLGTLLTAGLTIVAALQNIAEEMENTRLKTVLLTVRTRILEGHTLAYGMNEFPEVFPDLYRATIAAGDKSGHLDDVINKLALNLDQEEHIRQKIQQAMIYPALLTFVSFTIIFFLLTYAMPKITQTFIESGQTLPAVTSVLLAFSRGLKTYGIYVLIFIFLMIMGFKHFLKSDKFRFRYQLFLLKIPILNKAITITNAARFARTFGILFAAGVPVSQAMQTANSIITLLPMKAAIKHAITQVTEGLSIHQALSQTGYFTKMSTQLIASGETSGKLELMLEKTAAYQEQQVIRWTTTILALFEPVMILFMGIVVLFIVLAILLPIFQLNEFFG